MFESITSLIAGQNLDDLIAEKVMGWEREWYGVLFGKYGERNLHGPLANELEHSGNAVAFWSDSGHEVSKWHPSIDIFAATEMEARLEEMGNMSSYVGWLQSVVLKKNPEIMYAYEIGRLLRATPEQRCKAALLTVQWVAGDDK